MSPLGITLHASASVASIAVKDALTHKGLNALDEADDGVSLEGLRSATFHVEVPPP